MGGWGETSAAGEIRAELDSGVYLRSDPEKHQNSWNNPERLKAHLSDEEA
jgi:hypothetical protein